MRLLLTTTLLTAAALTAAADGVGGALATRERPAQPPTRADRRWMSALDGRLSLSALSIPGTHDSAALRNGTPLKLARCQRWPIAVQLAAGIRYLDIRCRRVDDRFRIHHGPIDQRLDFAAVRDACEGFLRDNPRECIVMRLQPEHTPLRATRSFAATLTAYLKGREARWRRDARVPTLAEARGQVVLLSSHAAVGGLRWGRPQQIQDRYDLGTLPLLTSTRRRRAAFEAKWQAVARQLLAARQGPARTWYLNHTSATSSKGDALASPERVARALNPRLLAALADGPPGRLGTVIMDFPGQALIRAIVAANRVGTRPK